MTDPSPPPQAQQASSHKRHRTIQTLSEEQLRNKRLVDRKAQRAFRQRSKDCMINLAALQEVCRQKDREIEELRDRNTQLLSHLRTICQSTSVAARLLEEGNGSEQGSGVSWIITRCVLKFVWLITPVGTVPQLSGTNDMARQSPDVPAAAEHECPGSAVSSPVISEPANEVSPPRNVSDVTARTTVDKSRQNPYYSTAVADFRATEEPLLPIPEPTASQSPAYDRSHATASNPPVAGGYDELSPDDLGSRPSFPGSATSSGMHGPSSSTRAIVSRVLPAHSMPTCPLDHILADFRQSRCHQLSQGFPFDRVVGPSTTIVTALFDHEHATDGPPLSVMLAEVLSTFPHPKRTEKLAFFYLMYQTMRVSAFD